MMNKVIVLLIFMAFSLGGFMSKDKEIIHEPDEYFDIINQEIKEESTVVALSLKKMKALSICYADYVSISNFNLGRDKKMVSIFENISMNLYVIDIFDKELKLGGGITYHIDRKKYKIVKKILGE